MLIGYARVSTQDQSLSLQEDALEKAGCERIFRDVASGADTERGGLRQAVEIARAGDQLVVWRFDRLGRSMRHLVELVAELEGRKVDFRSLTEAIDTSTPSGKLFFHFSAALCQFERDLIVERTMAGLASAKARGRLGGHPHKLDGAKLQLLGQLLEDKRNSTGLIAEALEVSRRTIYRAAKRLRQQRAE